MWVSARESFRGENWDAPFITEAVSEMDKLCSNIALISEYLKSRFIYEIITISTESGTKTSAFSANGSRFISKRACFYSVNHVNSFYDRLGTVKMESHFHFRCLHLKLVKSILIIERQSKRRLPLLRVTLKLYHTV